MERSKYHRPHRFTNVEIVEEVAPQVIITLVLCVMELVLIQATAWRAIDFIVDTYFSDPATEDYYRDSYKVGVPIITNALVKYIVGESENCSNNLFECLSAWFAEDSSPKLGRSDIRCQFVL